MRAFSIKLCALVLGLWCGTALNVEASEYDIWQQIESLAGNGGYLSEEESESNVGAGQSESGTLYAEDLPTAYDNRENGLATPVQTQNYGDCWAFASLELLQTSAVKKGLIDVTDLSERHLVYYSFHSVGGNLGQQEGEFTTFTDGNDMLGCFRNGGRFEYAARTLSSYVGAVAETAAPYEGAALPLPDALNAAYGNACLRLQNSYIINAKDRNALKSAVLNYGAVGITYYSGLAYYNYSTAAQNCPLDIREDHAVVVIGWDDNYPKDNFQVQPSANGAWLVKNNWSTAFGDGGYFWLSYEDASIADNAYIMEAATDVYDYIYQCDNTLLDGTETASTSMKVANVYTLEAEGKATEYIKAVNITVPVGGMNYQIQIYRDGTGEDPESGVPLLMEPIAGTMPCGGVYTVSLPEPVEAARGSRIAIVLQLEGTFTGITTDTTRVSYRTRCQATGGIETSYRKGENGWEDYGLTQNRNFRIKLLTSGGRQAEKTVPEVYQNYLDCIRQGIPETAIEQLYEGMLQREGEPAGMSYWKNIYAEGASDIELLQGFLYSDEFAMKHPELWEQRESLRVACLEQELNIQLEDIQLLYQNILGREYDWTGLVYWGRRKAEGIPIQEIEAGFYDSVEYLSVFSVGMLPKIRL